MLDTSEFNNKIIKEKVIPPRKATYSDFPEMLLPEIKQYLIQQSGISKLYCHQAEMFEKSLEGSNIVITTSTASGKTLSFLLPILQEILKNPLTRAIFVYPTKALASDQYRNIKPILQYFGKNKIQAGVYDGDTPVNERSRIRNSANIILTNPEMLNSAFLPHHNNYGFNFIFSNLKYIVIDELHSYRGAFGSHLANVFKRMERVSKYYNSSPQFLCSSATIANPIELAENICGKSFTLVDNDGSPAPEKHYYIWQPPIVDSDYRVPPAEEAANLIPKMVLQDCSFIAFCKSRKAVEVILKESRDKLKYDGITGQDFSNLIAGYRGGYKPEERKEIEQKMVAGKLKGLVSTNALELGIDIGSVDSTIITGFPGTRASFWQQSGRAGRKGTISSTFLILDNLPFDQYIAIDPQWLFSTGSENAVIDKNNLFIQLAHVRAAAAELPLTPDDISLFPDLGEIVPVLLKAKELKNENGKFVWCGKEFPAGDYSLRNMDKVRYKLKNIADNTMITEMDELQAFREIYNGAIYMHEGLSYQVEKFDSVGRIAEARPIDVNYYTVPNDILDVEKIQDMRNIQLGRTVQHFGDVRVTNTITGYKRMQFHNHDNLGFEELDSQLSKSFDTEGFWIDLPQNVVEVYRKLIPQKPNDTKLQYWKDYFYGLGFALLNSTMMTTMTTNDDVGEALLNDAIQGEPIAAICIFDLYVGGLGFSDKAYDHALEIVNNAIKMVSGCKCKDGCPACVGDYKLDKNVVLWGLKNIFDEITPPKNIKILEIAPEVYVEKKFTLNTLPEKWEEFIKFIVTTGEYLTEFLTTVKSVRVDNNRLILKIENEFYKSWILDDSNMAKLKNIIAHYVSVPKEFEIDSEIADTESNITNAKVSKRFEDLTK